MLTPELLAEVWVFLQELSGGLTLEILGNLGYRELRWHGNEQVDMVFGDMPSDDLDVVGSCDLSDEVSHTIAYVACEDWLSILGGPDKVILAIKDRVRGFAI